MRLFSKAGREFDHVVDDAKRVLTLSMRAKEAGHFERYEELKMVAMRLFTLAEDIRKESSM